MKNFKFFLPFAALGLLASCSNDNIGDQPAPVPGQSVGSDGMYMTVNISLPNKNTRAANDIVYEEGIEGEYEVKTMDLYLFELTEEQQSSLTTSSVEALAKCVKDPIKVGFATPATDDKTHGDVQKTYEATFQFTGLALNAETKLPANGSIYYGLLIINKGSDFIVPEEGETFDTYNEKVIAQAQISQDTDPANLMKNGTYFTMANAPQLDDSDKPFTLVKLNTTKFAESPDQAKESAADFYVQRGVAKVRLADKDGNSGEKADFSAIPVTTKKYEGGVEVDNDDTVSIDKWVLDITNTATFPVQNVTPFLTKWTSDWFKATEASTSTEAINHIWWGRDPNYDATQENHNNWKSLTGASTDYDKFNETNGLDPKTGAAYCLENTMDYTQMNKNQTTRVVLKATYKIDGEELATGQDAESGFIVFAGLAMKVKSNDLKSTLTPETGTNYKYKLNNLIKTDEEGATTTLEKYRNTLKMADYSQVVTYYPNGTTYYSAYIYHFDPEAETPLTVEQKKDLTSLEAYNADQLGRYGVLRNNAYEIRIVGVYGYGSPEIPVPDPGDVPVDKEDPKDYNAIVNVNILNWAKRSYDYTPR